MVLAFVPFDLQLKRTWTISSGAKSGGGADVVPTVLIKLTSGDLVGLGEAATTNRYQESVSSIQQFLRRIDASKLSFDEIPGSMAYLEALGPGNFSAKCGVNIALLDGAARKAGKAIYHFLGLGFTENKHATSYTIGIDTAAVIREKTIDASIYPILKLKTGIPEDRENLTALRAAAPTKTVRVDANEGWTTKEEALRNIEWLAQDPNIEFVEQPMPATTSRKDLAWLKERSPLPLFGDESYHHARDIDLCAECYHGVNVKLIKAGGITLAYDALEAARKAGLKTMIGCMIETSILISAAAHLAELTNHLDIDGNILIKNDPYTGPTAERGMISFVSAIEQMGLRVKVRGTDPLA